MDWRINYWNKGAERVFGWTAAEALGKNPIDLLMRGVKTPLVHQAIKATLEKGEWSGELTEVTKGGKTVIVQGRSTLIRDDRGKPKAVLVIDTEITEKKKLEEQFLRSQRMESLGTLASGIAHDLNNVLTPLLIAVQLLKDKVTDPEDETLLDALESNVHRGAELVKQVLTFGRGVLGVRVRIQPINIVREIGQIVEHTFPKSIEFEFRAPEDLWAVIGDPTQIHQVLLNFCVNARDAMPEGGKLSIHLENIVIDEIYAGANPDSRPGSYLLITVADTGTGMSKEVQTRIFEPFFTTKKPGEGTGLGLSTSLGIVKGHGGFINCYSEPGKGSAFKIYLSANPTPAAAEQMASGHPDLPRGGNQLVLVVDDEEPIRRVAQAVLEQFGYRVLLAADGSEAVTLYAAHGREIAAIITDIAMPVMDGPSEIAAIKAINPEVIIVGSSGLDAGNDLTRTVHAGIKHFIRKPYAAETMLRTLDKALNSPNSAGSSPVGKH
jgi:two-component system cell cycle sensor histidine kinase/response regulator CckA